MKKKLLILSLAGVIAAVGAFALAGTKKAPVQGEEGYFEELLIPSKDGVVTYTANQKVPAYSYDGSFGYATGIIDIDGVAHIDDPLGLGVNFSEEVTLSYAKPIYLADNTKGDEANPIPLVELAITPKNPVRKDPNSETVTQGDIEFGRVTIRLEDVNDASNYIDIMGRYSPFNSHQTYCQVETPNMSRAGYNQGTLTNEYNNKRGYGTSSWIGFSGDTNQTLAFYYDYNSMDVTVDNSYNDFTINSGLAKIRNVGAATDIVSGDILFGGFSSRWVNLKIIFSDVFSEDCNVIIRSVDGQRMLTDKYDKLIDTSTPIVDFSFLYDNDTPVGEANSFYPYVQCTGYDFLDGYDVDINVDVYEGKHTVEECASLTALKGANIKKDGFTPDHSGLYTLVYTATDKSGLESEKTCKVIRITQYLSRPTFVFDKEFEEEVLVGSKIEVPKATIEGGSGFNNVSIAIYEMLGGSLISNTNKFTASKAGYYQIVYSFVDDVFGEGEYVTYVKAVISDKPVFEKAVMPIAVMSGKPFFVPTIKAIDYLSYNGMGVETEVVKYVKEEGVDANGGSVNTDWVVVEGSYTPTIASGKLKVKYYAEAILDQNSRAYSEVYEIDVVYLQAVKGKLQEFFIQNGDFTTTEINAGINNTQFVFTPNTAGSYLQFVNPVVANSFTSTYNFDFAYSTIKSMSVVLADSQNTSEKITIKLYALSDEKVAVCFSGKIYEVDGSLIKKGDKVGLVSVNYANGIISGENGKIDKVQYYDDGSDFKGFSSGKVYYTLTFDELDNSGVEKTGVRITNFCGKPTFAKQQANNQPPVITFEGTVSTYSEINTTVLLPSAMASDLFDPNVDVFLRIYAPDGTIVVNGVDASVRNYFTLEQPGKYDIMYYVNGSNGKETTSGFAIYSTDIVDPTIDVYGQYKTAQKIGSELKVFKAKAHDNIDTDEDLELKVYMLRPDTYFEYLGDGSQELTYTFTQQGIYRLRYFVFDSYGNYCQKIYEIKVGE